VAAAAAQEAVGCAAKVWVVDARLLPGDDGDGDDGEEAAPNPAAGLAETRRRCRVECLVEGPLPREWVPPAGGGQGDAGEEAEASAGLNSRAAPEVRLQGRCWNAPLWVPDRHSAEALFSGSRGGPGVSAAALQAASAAHGTLAAPGGLFPAPLPAGADGALVLRRFKFLGRLFGKVGGASEKKI
jgi:hypothetical protein